MELSMRLEQKQILSQRMIQSAEILQMASAELEEYLTEQSMENPVMELAAQKPAAEPVSEHKELDKYQWISSHDEQNRYLYQKMDAPDDDERPEWNMDTSQPETLFEHLWSQLLTRKWPKEQEEALKFLLQSLDAKGWFVDSLSEFAARFGLTEEQAKALVALVQELEPAGVGAGNLSECLILQLKRDGRLTPELSEFIECHLQELAKNQLPAIARAMKCSVAEVKSFAAVVRSLDPKPASRFCDVRQINYVVPDVIIVKFEGHFDLLLNDSLYPDIRMNMDYVRMAKDADSEVKQYLNEKIRKAEWLKQCISQRNATLLSVAGDILKRQQAFFRYGASALKPMTLADVAEDLGIHESTVSRAVKQKYLQCSYGIFPLSYFFPKASPALSRSRRDISGGDAVAQASCAKDREDMTVRDVKDALRSIIAGEPKKKPYSDRILAEKLTAAGMEISRRTVAKYREEEQIPPASERKEY